MGIAFGAAVGLLFAWLVAMMPEPDGNHYYLQIMAPGFLVGAIVGFLTQRLGTPAAGTPGGEHAKVRP
jgi:ABC-type antimicrobial peptide transport system permease subunit